VSASRCVVDSLIVDAGDGFGLAEGDHVWVVHVDRLAGHGVSFLCKNKLASFLFLFLLWGRRVWKAWRPRFVGGLLRPGSFDECFVEYELVGVGFSVARFASDDDVWRSGESHCAAVYGALVFVLGEGYAWFEFMVAASDWLGVACDAHGWFLSAVLMVGV
jgi:hypothetical protein